MKTTSTFASKNYSHKIQSGSLKLFIVLICLIITDATAVAQSIFTTTGAVNTGNIPYAWNNTRAWKQDGGTATRFPISTDIVQVSHSISIPAGVTVSCLTLTLNATDDSIGVFIKTGASLTVNGDLKFKSPKNATETSTIRLPQSNLTVNGNLLIGEIPNNSYGGNVKVIVSGNQTSFGTLKVTGNISNNNTYNNPPVCYLEVQGYGNLELGGTLENSLKFNPTFTINTTTVFNGTRFQTLPTGVAFGNLVIDNPAGVTLSEPLNSTSNLLGNLEVRSGYLDNNGFAISGKASKTLTVKDGAKLVLYSTSAFPTGFTQPVTLEPASTVTYSGTTTQNVAIQPYGNLELLGGAGKQKILLGNVSAGNTTVDADLMMDQGKLTIGASNTFTLKSNGAIRTVTSAHYIVLSSGAKMIVENVGPLGRNQEVTYPIGTSAGYTPAYIRNFGTTNKFAIAIETGVVDYYNNNTPLIQDVVNKTWHVECLNQTGTPNVSLRLQWNLGDETPGFENKKCFVTHYTNNMWTKSDVYQDASLTGMIASMDNIQSFSPFSVADAASPLPVELVYFKAEKKDNAVALTWETATEKNSQGFGIQASADGRNFETVAYVASKNGNANYNQRYEYLDKTSRSGLVYYRLKQTDLDGTETYYPIKVVDMGRFTETVATYPNPFQQQFEVKLQAGAAQEIQLQVMDLSGKTVYTLAPKVIAGENVIPVALNQNLPNGMYILTAKTATQLYTTRIVKQ